MIHATDSMDGVLARLKQHFENTVHRTEEFRRDLAHDLMFHVVVLIGQEGALDLLLRETDVDIRMGVVSKYVTEVVREVASMDPSTQDGSEWTVCFFCGNSLEYLGEEKRTDHAHHKTTCLWRVCQEKVAVAERRGPARLHETPQEGAVVRSWGT